MLHTIDKSADAGKVQYTRPAVLTRMEVDDGGTRLWVRIEHEHAMFVVPARSALQQAYDPQVGDELLVSGEDFRCCYVIGVLSTTGARDHRAVTTKSGAVARCRRKDGHETLSIEDEQGHLLFEYSAAQRRSRLYAPTGDLALTAPDGNIELVSGKSIGCRSLGGIVMESATATQMRVTSGDGYQSAFSLTDKAMLLSGKKIGIRAESGDFRVVDAIYQGERFKAVLERSKLLVGKLESVAIRIMERARNVYRHVEELHQTRAGRVRTLVEGSYQLKSETTYVEARKNVNIDGERIHLG